MPPEENLQVNLPDGWYLCFHLGEPAWMTKIHATRIVVYVNNVSWGTDTSYSHTCLPGQPGIEFIPITTTKARLFLKQLFSGYGNRCSSLLTSLIPELL